ncbi:beta-ketoacyl-ACP synthase III [Scatolibacter rhodanostii]|uniref:beta-ketoacyl-ACP synthase III n=1 Tax=Scatolibacter rhodanostii TaxID=2014781 RepID=UPI000C0742EC|nr:beta-ketoacyl-ACP synthase III [Scatolibacter rhodanostii]
MSFKILGTGRFLPKKILTNEELSQRIDTSDEWITKRIGVKQRHVCTTETTLDMAEQAALQALEISGIKPEELDLIIGTTISPDSVSPGIACMVQNRIGASCPAFDMSAACSGFVFALDVAAGYFARKAVKKVLIVSAERLSSMIDWTDRGTCCIFGDGAGAAVLGEGEGYLSSHMSTYGGDDAINIPTHLAASPFYENEIVDAHIAMNGRETYKFAVKAVPDEIEKALELADVKPEDIAWVVPHQANYRIIQEASNRFPSIDKERFCVNIDRYGNTSSASIPILLDELNREGKLKAGDKIVIVGFGGGLTCGGAVISW